MKSNKSKFKIDFKTTGTKIRKARKAAGMTQQDLAEATGFSVPYIANIERGVSGSLLVIYNIAWALDASIDDFLSIPHRGVNEAPSESQMDLPPEQMAVLKQATVDLYKNLKKNL